MENREEILAKVVDLNNTLTEDVSELSKTLNKLNISLQKLNLEYQWMRQGMQEKGEK